MTDTKEDAIASKAMLLQSKITHLAEALKEVSPAMPNILREIHTTLKGFPEVVTLLTEEEIGVIVSGLCKQSNINLVPIVAKTSKSLVGFSKKELANTTVDDI